MKTQRNMRSARHTLSLGLFALSLASTGLGQSVSGYRHTRNKLHLTSATPISEVVPGTSLRYAEIRGVIKGSFSLDGKTQFLIDDGSGHSLMVTSVHPSDWLTSNEVHARFIVELHPGTSVATAEVDLLYAVDENLVKVAEAQPALRKPLKRESRSTRFNRPNLASRSATRKSGRHWVLPPNQMTPYYASFIKKVNPRLTNDVAIKIAEAIIGFSIQYGVDARLTMAIVLAESEFDPNSTSRTGAKGLGQLMPSTARWMGVTNPYDTTDNLHGAVKLIRTHLDDYRRQTGNEYTSTVLAIAAYNAGAGAVKKHAGVPPYRETQAYVRKVLRIYADFCGNG